jgi:hypothetical protein
VKNNIQKGSRKERTVVVRETGGQWREIIIRINSFDKKRILQIKILFYAFF